MITPIYDFVKGYSSGNNTRMHMPGHKGKTYLGAEALDITEVGGADVLYSASGIILESENNATKLFGTSHTYYSTEGSTLAIKAMLMIIAKARGGRASILAARNIHRAFVDAAALLDIDVRWLYGEASSLCECKITPEEVRVALEGADNLPAAFYLTSPDYLGNIADIKGIVEVCDEYRVPVIVDNAHGAYLAFLKPSCHPIALGAAMCADSAHKTLPVLTGGAYLHISNKYAEYNEYARESLSAFASTSPSYLTLSSLDLCNKYLSDSYCDRLRECISRVDKIKEEYGLNRSVEPLKIVIGASVGTELRKCGIECEMCDGETTVLMISPENTEYELDKLSAALSTLNINVCTEQNNAPIPHGKRVVSIREAYMSRSEKIKVEDSLGRISGAPTVSCPPAVPIVIAGELICEEHIKAFIRYGIDEVIVIK